MAAQAVGTLALVAAPFIIDKIKEDQQKDTMLKQAELGPSIQVSARRLNEYALRMKRPDLMVDEYRDIKTFSNPEDKANYKAEIAAKWSQLNALPSVEPEIDKQYQYLANQGALPANLSRKNPYDPTYVYQLNKAYGASLVKKNSPTLSKTAVDPDFVQNVYQTNARSSIPAKQNSPDSTFTPLTG